MKRTVHAASLILLIACFCNCQRKSEPEGAILPIAFVDISGPRPVISYFINGKPATSMIHSNAGMYIQLSPENATYFGVDMTENGTYGISEPGKVNVSYSGIIDEIKIGNLTYNDKSVAVFSKYPPDGVGFGMLGRPWIEENRIILNYNNNTVAIQPSKHQQDSIKESLLSDGYMPVPMEMGEGYNVEITINNEKAKFSVNTVSNLFIDSVFAVRANITRGDVAGTYGGPGGAVGYIYDVNDSINIKIGEFETTAIGYIEDRYEYSNTKRPEDVNESIGGSLSGSFMIDNKAVIDFGNLTLYLKPR